MFIKDIVNSTLRKLNPTNKPVTRDSFETPSVAPASAASTRPRITDPEAAQAREAQGYADTAMDSLNRDITASNQLGQEKIAEKSAPIPKVSGWRRALYGALSNIATKNPKDDWGEILGAGIGGGAVNAASERVYETGMRRDRNAQIDEQYRDREEELGRQTDADRKLAELSRVRLGDIDRRSDRKEGREIQRENAATRRDQAEYQKILKETAQTSLDAYRKSQTEQENRKIELRSKEIEQNNKLAEKRIQISSRALAEQITARLSREANDRKTDTYRVTLPVTIDGETKMQTFYIPSDREASDYFSETYSPNSPITKAASKGLGKGKRPVTTPIDEATKKSNSSNTFSATDYLSNRSKRK